MENGKRTNLFEEHLRKIKYNTGYVISESPRYRPLVGVDEEFDNLPTTNEAGEQEDAMKPAGGEVPPEPSNDQPINSQPPVPEFDKDAAGAPPVPPEGGMPPPVGDPNMMPAEPVQDVDDIQNEIIKHNIEAMKSIHDQLENLNNITQSLSTQLQGLNADVEEVREPTNSEKLMSKVNVSYPFNYNLNDFWSGNWFNEQREGEVSKGIKEMPDGTFIADFDELPQKSSTDIQNSFNDI